MLVREEQNKKVRHVEFVSYTGKYPNLCRGILTLKIDGETVTFGNFFSNKVDYPEFWATGGSCGFSSGFPEGYVNRGEWLIYESELPIEYKVYAIEIERVFNENVPHGCCGGCLWNIQASGKGRM